MCLPVTTLRAREGVWLTVLRSQPSVYMLLVAREGEGGHCVSEKKEKERKGDRESDFAAFLPVLLRFRFVF